MRLWTQQCFFWCLWTITASSSVSVNEDNGYTELIVAISENIERDSTLIRDFQDLIQQTSAILYEASDEKVFIADVQIVVPRSWATTYDSVPIRFEDADIRIDVQNPLHGDIPYTQQVRPCGERGEYIHITPAFVHRDTDVIKRTGNTSKALVHEWAHYRWGVFEEYGYPGDPLYPYFYKTQEGYWAATGCNGTTISGSLSTTSGETCYKDQDGKYEDDCRFYPTSVVYGNDPVSLMYMHDIKKLLPAFCDDDHNMFAPTKQNALCNHRSIWSVLQQHGDFQAGSSGPSNLPATNFTIVQPDASSTALNLYILLDISNDEAEKLNVMKSELIQTIEALPDEAKVGLATYNGLRDEYTFNELHPLIELGPDRQSIIYELVSIEPYTGSADSYQALMDVTRRTGDASDVVLLFTQFARGAHEETDAISSLVEHNIRVFGIAFDFSSSAPNMLQICTETKGRYVLAESPYLSDVRQALEASVDQSNNQIYLVENKDLTLKPDDHYVELFIYLEEVLSNDVYFIMTSSLLLHFEIMSPSGYIYDSNSEICNILRDDTVCKISVAESGNWQVVFGYVNDSCGADCQSLDVSLKVYSYQRADGATPPSIKVWTTAEDNIIDLSTNTSFFVFVELTLDRYPLANVLVTVRVRDTIAGDVYTYMALDNGRDPDITANDGVYTALIAPVSTNPLTIDVTLRTSEANGAQVLIHNPWGILPLDQDDYCCGSTTNSTQTYTFQRTLENVLTVSLKNIADKELWPQMIQDLKVAGIIYWTETVKYVDVILNWTAPSPRDGTGSVQKYELYFSYSEDNLIPSVSCCSADDIVGGSLVPLQEGESQTVIIRVRMPATSSGKTAPVFFRILSQNIYDKISQPSPMTFGTVHLNYT